MTRKLSRFARSQKAMIIAGILSLVSIIVILQLWLFTATMNAYLNGDVGILWPAASASLFCLALNGGLLKYLYDLEQKV